MNEPSPLLLAIYQDDYEYLEKQAPHFLTAIAQELQTGKTPADVKHIIYASTTADRSGLAVRCYNAAMHMVALMGE